MPTDDFYVCEIPGLAVNAHLDVRNQNLGYVCFMRKGVQQIRFFDWYEKKVMIPTVLITRERYEGLGNVTCTKVDAENNVVHWSDSDIPYLQQLAEPGRMEASIRMGILNCKIGAKITDKVQPMDVGSGFKVLKTTARTNTCVGTETSLTKFVTRAFEDMRSMNQLKLSSMKEVIVIDCLLTSPTLLSKSYSPETMKKSFVNSGMLDAATMTSPCLFGIMKAFNINWKK